MGPEAALSSLVFQKILLMLPVSDTYFDFLRHKNNSFFRKKFEKRALAFL